MSDILYLTFLRFLNIHMSIATYVSAQNSSWKLVGHSIIIGTLLCGFSLAKSQNVISI